MNSKYKIRVIQKESGSILYLGNSNISVQTGCLNIIDYLLKCIHYNLTALSEELYK